MWGTPDMALVELCAFPSFWPPIGNTYRAKGWKHTFWIIRMQIFPKTKGFCNKWGFLEKKLILFNKNYICILRKTWFLEKKIETPACTQVKMGGREGLHLSSSSLASSSACRGLSEVGNIFILYFYIFICYWIWILSFRYGWCIANIDLKTKYQIKRIMGAKKYSIVLQKYLFRRRDVVWGT